MYLGARQVELAGAAGEQLRAQRGIIPGCAFATTLLLLLQEETLREVRASHPHSQHSERGQAHRARLNYKYRNSG